jgi:peptidoglycan/LPS O-acetylase OafA/YrhL
MSFLSTGRARSSSRPPAASSAKTKSFRPDIQGLRALAVVAVVLDHLLAWPSGGFVGVDVFFVISGFLITGHLVRTYETTGRISFSDFYVKRIKRILPAAMLVLIATVGAGFFVFNQIRARETLVDGIWSMLFAANWRQTAIGTDYFAATGPVSPLQHYWSLAVEEQFYFVWPWLMLALFVISAKVFRAGNNPRLVAGVAMLVLTGGSFAWSVWETATSPTVAYFSTLSRAWELGIGALLAIVSPLLPRIADRVRPYLAWVGLAGIGVSLFVIDASVAFPAPTAALPVLATAFVIAAGTGGTPHRYLAPLTNPVSGYIGNISYSVYLWHFPVIIIGGSLFPDTGVVYFLVTALVIMLLSVFAYHLVEDPLRKMEWSFRRSPHRSHQSKVSTSYKATVLGALGALTLALVIPLLLPSNNEPTTALVTELPDTAAVEEEASTDGPEITSLQEQIASALSTAEWPELSPTMEQAISENPEPEGVNKCGTTVAPDIDECIWGDPDAPKTAMVVGDSIAIAWMPALIGIYGEGEWNLSMRAQYGCPFTDRGTDGIEPDCIEHKAAVVSEIQASAPDLLIVANNYPDSGNASSWGSEVSAMLKSAAGATQTIVLSSAPHGADVAECYRPGSTPADCKASARGWYQELVFAERRSVEATGATYIGTQRMFCSTNGECPAFVGETPVKMDSVHMTPWYAEKVIPALKELLAPAST